MKQVIKLQITGLKTNPSPLVEDQGGLQVASNINIDSPNTATSRRGINKYLTQKNISLNEIKRFFTFKDTLLFYWGTTLTKEDGSGWTDFSGTFTAVDGERSLRAIKMNGNFYFNTTEGVKKLESLTDIVRSAGVPKGLNTDYTLTNPGGTALDPDCQVAYRVIWGYKDENDNLVLGAPSERISVINDTTDPQDVTLTIYIPDGITTEYFFQVYRSGYSANSDTVANDDLGLVYEGNLISDNIDSDGYVEITDTTPDELIGATIYTSPTQEGINQSNYEPPYCKDMTVYKNYAMYANTKTKHRFYLTLIAVEAGMIGVTITIGSTTYTGAAVESVSSGEFIIDTSGTVSENIENTAKSLIKVINGYGSNTDINAYYISGYNDLPGQMLFERKNLTDSIFGVSVSGYGDNFNPVLDTSADDFSENEVKPNRVYISKFSQPESVPLLQYIDAGEDNSEIVRIIALRDSVFIFKDNGEIYRLIGSDLNSFEIDLFDNTAKLYGARTAVIFNNSIYCYTTQGIVSVSDGGVAIKSWDIEDKIKEFLSTDIYPDFKDEAFGVSYESDRKYMLCYGGTMYVFNSLTNSWTTWDLDKTAGIVNLTDNKLYFADSNGYIWQERKNYNRFDYSDESFDITITNTDDYTIWVSDTTNIEVGMSIKQGESASYITEISSDNIIVEDLLTWNNTTASIHKAIKCEMEWLPIRGGNPGVMKRYTDVMTFFRDNNGRFTLYFKNNFYTTYTSQEITPTFSTTVWGGSDWGDFVWGGDVSGAQEIRCYYPLTHQRCLWTQLKIETNEPFISFKLNGLSLYFNQMGNKFRRSGE